MKNVVFRRVIALLTAAILSFAMLSELGLSITVRADEGVTLKLHYHREDGKYDGWDVWMWPDGGEGAGIPFEDEGGEMVATYSVPAGKTKVGFIVRTQDWDKDVDMDQFIDLSEVVSGTVHAYVESGVEGAVKEYGEDVMTGTKLKNAVYDGDKTITIELTGEISDSQIDTFYVSGRLGEIEVTKAELKEKASDTQYFYNLTIGEALDSNRNYRLGFDGQEFPVNMPIVYSTKEFEDKYTYEGDDLGATVTADKTVFRVWAPTAESVSVNLYESGDPWKKDLIRSVEMT